MAYQLIYRGSVAKDLAKVPKGIGERLVERAEALCATPRPAGCVKLSGRGNLWRVRVGDYRIVYAIDDRRAEVDVRMIGHRREVYRDL